MGFGDDTFGAGPTFGGVGQGQTPHDWMVNKKAASGAIKPLAKMPNVGIQPQVGQAQPTDQGFDGKGLGVPGVGPVSRQPAGPTPGQAFVGSAAQPDQYNGNKLSPYIMGGLKSAGSAIGNTVGPALSSMFSSWASSPNPVAPSASASPQQRAPVPNMASLPQVTAQNVAMAPHQGGDGPAVLRPDVQPGAPSAQPAPAGPMASPAQPVPAGPMAGPSQPLAPPVEDPTGQLLSKQLKMRWGSNGGMQGGPAIYRGGQLSPEDQFLISSSNDHTGAMSQQLAAQAHMVTAQAHADPLGPYKNAFGVDVLNNQSHGGGTPDQKASMSHALGLVPEPGMEPYYQPKPGDEPFSPEDMMRVAEEHSQGKTNAQLQAELYAHHARQKYEESGEPSTLDHFGHWSGWFPGGWKQAMENKRRYQKFYPPKG